MKTKLVDLAAPLGFTEWCLSPKIEIRWSSPQLRKLREADYPAFVAACGEQVALCVGFWRERYQLVPRFIMPFNEPTSGNSELADGSAKEVAEIVRAIGEQLKADGFGNVKLVVPCEETVAHSLAVAEAILSDEQARPFVGAIGYHCYPYGSPYASVPRILDASGKGHPDQQKLKSVNGYGISAEVPRAALDDGGLALGRVSPVVRRNPRSSHSHSRRDALRRRVRLLCDERHLGPDVAPRSLQRPWRGQAGELFTEQDTVVLVDNDKQAVHITGMGYAIGHYARWVRRGAVRIEAESSDPLVQVTAFRDDAGERIVLVAINNSPQSQHLLISAKGFSLAGRISGEQSTAHSFWNALMPAEVGQKESCSWKCLAWASRAGDAGVDYRSDTNPCSARTRLSELYLSNDPSPSPAGLRSAGEFPEVGLSMRNFQWCRGMLLGLEH